MEVVAVHSSHRCGVVRGPITSEASFGISCDGPTLEETDQVARALAVVTNNLIVKVQENESFTGGGVHSTSSKWGKEDPAKLG